MTISANTFTIANGASESSEVTFGMATLTGLFFDGWRASTGFYLKVRPNTGVTAGVLYDSEGYAVGDGIEPVANSSYTLEPSALVGKVFITLCSGAPGAAVTQDATRTVTVYTTNR